MSLPSQIITKNLTRHERVNNVLWVNPGRDSSWQDVANYCQHIKLFCQDFGDFSYHQQSGAEATFGAFPEQSQTFDWIILTLPRQKALLQMLLECAKGLLTPGGSLWLAGENKAGIKSSDKLLKKHFGKVQKLDNARHCTLFEATDASADKPFNSSDYLEVWQANPNGANLQVASYPGVFAHGRLDAGSALLLETLVKQDIEGSVLDFGCGSGVIGATLAALPQVDVTFLDTSALALYACEQTLSLNGLNGTLLPSDGLASVETRFDLIISNPPIHSGVKTDNHLSMQLLENIEKHLQPGGRLVIVANRHLPYEKWLGEKFKQVGELSCNQHFKVLNAG